MNWLGAGLRSLLAALVGCVVGAWLFLRLRALGFDFAPVAGAVAGIATALFSTEKSGTRGFVVASFSVWSTATAEVLAAPHRSLLLDLLAFHERLGLGSALAYAGSAVIAIAVAGRAWAPGASSAAERPARETSEKGRASSVESASSIESA